YWILVCLAKQCAVATIREASQLDVARGGAHCFLACPTVGIGHGQSAQAGERVVPPCTEVNCTGGDVAVFALVEDVDTQVNLALGHVIYRRLQNLEECLLPNLTVRTLDVCIK